MLKWVGVPGTPTHFALCLAAGAFLIYVWPRSRKLGRIWISLVLVAYVVLALPSVASAIANRLPAVPQPLPDAVGKARRPHRLRRRQSARTRGKGQPDLRHVFSVRVVDPRRRLDARRARRGRDSERAHQGGRHDGQHARSNGLGQAPRGERSRAAASRSSPRACRCRGSRPWLERPASRRQSSPRRSTTSRRRRASASMCRATSRSGSAGTRSTSSWR